MISESVGRLCQLRKLSEFTEAPYNDLIVHTFCFKARRCA
jgi:hypothetical protein